MKKRKVFKKIFIEIFNNTTHLIHNFCFFRLIFAYDRILPSFFLSKSSYSYIVVLLSSSYACNY